MEDMTWWSYVQRVAGGDTNATIAKKVGVSPPSVSRWQGKNSADPAARPGASETDRYRQSVANVGEESQDLEG